MAIVSKQHIVLHQHLLCWTNVFHVVPCLQNKARFAPIILAPMEHPPAKTWPDLRNWHLSQSSCAFESKHSLKPSNLLKLLSLPLKSNLSHQLWNVAAGAFLPLLSWPTWWWSRERLRIFSTSSSLAQPSWCRSRPFFLTSWMVCQPMSVVVVSKPLKDPLRTWLALSVSYQLINCNVFFSLPQNSVFHAKSFMSDGCLHACPAITSQPAQSLLSRGLSISASTIGRARPESVPPPWKKSLKFENRLWDQHSLCKQSHAAIGSSSPKASKCS